MWAPAQIAAAGAIQPLGELLVSTNPSQRAAAARAITNLAMHSRNRQEMQNTGQVIPALVRMLRPCSSQMPSQTQKEVRSAFKWVLCWLIGVVNESFCTHALCPLICLMTDVDSKIKQGHLAAAKALRNIVADDGPRRAVREEGAVVALQVDCCRKRGQ